VILIISHFLFLFAFCRHADKEGDIVPGSTIASVSLGAKR
jgi:hypothetical protein